MRINVWDGLDDDDDKKGITIKRNVNFWGAVWKKYFCVVYDERIFLFLEAPHDIGGWQ